MILWKLFVEKGLFFETESKIILFRFSFFECPQKILLSLNEVMFVESNELLHLLILSFVILSLEKWFYREIPNSVRQLLQTQFVNITECSACSIAFVFWQLKIETRLKDIFSFKRNIIRNAAGCRMVPSTDSSRKLGGKVSVEAKYICQLERLCKY